MEIVYFPESKPGGDAESVACLQGTRNFERITVDMEANGVLYVVSQGRQEKAETRLFDDPGFIFVQHGNNLLKLLALLGQYHARNGFRIEVGDLPPIGSSRVQHLIAEIAHITPFPEPQGILDVRVREFRFFTHPRTTEPQRPREGAGAGSMHAKHKKRLPGRSLIQVLRDDLIGAHANHSRIRRNSQIRSLILHVNTPGP